MAFFEWSDELSVGIKDIDGQHKTLVEMINTLNQAMIEKKGQEAQKAAVYAMVAYTASHFTTEERYMRDFKYAGFEAHKAEHDRFTAKALDLQDRVGRGRFVLTLEIVDFLKQWLTGHIKGTDRLYRECFQAHGLHS